MNNAVSLECLNKVTTEEIVNKIHIILYDCQVKICEIAKMLNTSDKQVFNILHGHLYTESYQQGLYHVSHS